MIILRRWRCCFFLWMVTHESWVWSAHCLSIHGPRLRESVAVVLKIKGWVKQVQPAHTLQHKTCKNICYLHVLTITYACLNVNYHVPCAMTCIDMSYPLHFVCFPGSPTALERCWASASRGGHAAAEVGGQRQVAQLGNLVLQWMGRGAVELWLVLRKSTHVIQEPNKFWVNYHGLTFKKNG
jgi:hypothetical protein